MDSSAVYRYRHIIYRAALRMLRDEQDAEDVVQVVMVKAIYHFGEWRRDCSLLTWLWAIMTREVQNVRRKRVSEDRVLEAVQAEMEEGQESRPAEMTEEERAELVWSALDRVPDEYRVVLVLQHLCGYGVEKIARTMGYTRRRTETSITRARQLFKRFYLEEGEEEQDGEESGGAD